jgi:hypothetical protein
VLLVLVAGRALAAEHALWLTVEQDRAAGARALAEVRAKRALAAARTDYANSRFSACTARLERAEAALRRQLHRPADLELVKRVNLWIGLCHAVAGAGDRSQTAFLRAVRLPGAGPDPSLFPPAVMQQYRSAQTTATGRACRLRLTAPGEVELDGRRVEARSEVAPGEHYAQWAGRSDRVRINDDCRLVLDDGPTATAPQLTRREAGDRGFLAEVGRAAGVKQIPLAHIENRQVTVSVFDVEGGRFVQRRRALAASLGAEQACPVEPGRDGGSGSDGPAPRPWYKRWWVWTLVGVGVAAAVTIPLVLTQGRDTTYEVGF